MTTTFTAYDHAEINATNNYAVLADGNVDLTIDAASTSGWVRSVQTQVKKTNLQGTVYYATAAVFSKPSAGNDETLIINSDAETSFAGLDLGVS